MVDTLISNDLFISIVMAIVVAVLVFPFVIAILAFVLRRSKHNVSEKK